MAKKWTKSDCAGCRDDYYNYGGNSPSGECWRLADAKPVKRLLIGVDEPPPYKKASKAKVVPTCYRPARMVNVAPESIDSKGYWR